MILKDKQCSMIFHILYCKKKYDCKGKILWVMEEAKNELFQQRKYDKWQNKRKENNK